MYNCLVLLATYNGEKFIKEQLDSILNQDKVNVTVVISDDESTDATLDIIKSYSDDRICILDNIGKFGSASQNFFRLLRETDFSNYDYVSLADQDDVWNLDKVYHSINTLVKKEYDVYSSNLLAFWEDGKELLISKAQPQKKYDYLFSSASAGCTYVFKKELAINFQKELREKLELTKSIDLHDWLIYAYARTNNYNWYIDDYVTMRYRQHDNNEFGANKGFKTFVNRWIRSRDGWYRKQIINTATFCDIKVSPVLFLKSNKYIDRLRLLPYLFSFRRSLREVLFLGLTFIIPLRKND